MEWSDDLVDHIASLEKNFDDSVFETFIHALVSMLCGDISVEAMEEHECLSSFEEKQRNLIVNSFSLLVTDASRHHTSVSALSSIIGMSADRCTVIVDCIAQSRLRTKLSFIDSNPRPKLVDMAYVLSYQVKDQHDGFIGDDLAEITLQTIADGEKKPVTFGMTQEMVLHLRDVLKDAVEEVSRITKARG
ncbi:hypothetical protein J8273_4572 [Carpediemonas membranifera]|uniref:COMM domain-containing protein n=1 Tax=Carpediemonas membranifera TaxID=201153 RepID=A0A8J6BBL4_9EUKA|nr:hypothetical protein J8273_4572 [Carpediemonas membranifera]|eukprot:KAG9393972.1 hypothetical protein J8273_4572 [Carpediemonas membranifera]